MPGVANQPTGSLPAQTTVHMILPVFRQWVLRFQVQKEDNIKMDVEVCKAAN